MNKHFEDRMPVYHGAGIATTQRARDFDTGTFRVHSSLRPSPYGLRVAICIHADTHTHTHRGRQADIYDVGLKKINVSMCKILNPKS